MNTRKHKARRFVAWVLVFLLLVSSMVPAFAHYPSEANALDSQLPVFGWQIFNNGPGGTQYPRANPGLAAAGTIRMWAQLNGANAPVYFDAADTIVALDQSGNCAMEFVTVNQMWVAGTGWANYFNMVNVNKANGSWQYINLSITMYGETVHVLLVNALFVPPVVPVFGWNIFNNGQGGTQYPRANPGLAASGTIRMWAQLDGVNAPVYLAAADTIAALDQNGQCAMEFLRVNRVWVAGTGWADYFNMVDVDKDGGAWQYINMYITVYGQTVHALLVNALFEPQEGDVTVTFVVQAGAVGVYAAATTTVEVPAGEAIPAEAIPSTDARAGFYFAGWYPSDPAEFGPVTEAVTFTARFNPLFHYVTFEAGAGGELTPTSFGLVMNIRDGFAFWPDRVPTPVADDGYEFVEWYPANPAGFVVRDSMTFTAVFARDTEPPPPDVFDFIFLLFDDYAIDRILAPTMLVPNFNDGSLTFTQTNPDTIAGMYYNVFNRFGRTSRQANIDGRPAWQALFGYFPGDGTFDPELGAGVHKGMYELLLVAAIGKTVDNDVFRPAGNPARAENELYIQFGVRTQFPADTLADDGPIGDNRRAFSLFGYNGTSAVDRAAFAGFDLRYSEYNSGVLEAWIVENGIERDVPLLGTTEVFGVDNHHVWFDINIYARMATSATAGNGILRVYVDGILEIEATNLNWYDPVFGFNDVGLYATTNCPTGPALGTAIRWYGPLKVARIPNAVITDPNETRLTRFFMESGRRQQQLSDTRTHYDITMEPGTPEFVVSLWPLADDAEIWVNGIQYGHGQPIRFNLTAIEPRPAFADTSTGNRSWGIVDHAGIFEIEIVPAGGPIFSQIYTFSVEMLMPYTVAEEPRPEWLWWDDFSDWSRTQGSYAGRGNPVASSTTAFFNPTAGTGRGGTWSLEARFDRSIVGDYGAFSAPDVSFQFNDPWGTNIQQRPDGSPLPSGRQIDYEAAGFPAGTNALIDDRGDIDDMFVRFYLRMDKDWGNYLLWDDPSFWGPGRPGGAAGNNGQNFIGQGSGGGHDKLMRFMGRTHGTNYTQPGPFSGQPALGPQVMANGVVAPPSNGHMAQTFILHSWTMGGSHPHHFLGLDPTSGVDILTTNHGGQRLWQQQWPGTPVADRLPGVAFRAWDRTNWFNTAEAAWHFKRNELTAQFESINAINALPLAERPAGAMPGFAAPGSGHVVITERQNDFNYLNWLGASTGGGQFPNIPIFDSDHVGEWYLVEQRVRLNTPGQNDGIMQLWIDEKLVVERTDINFRGWNIEAGITRIQLEVYANSPRGATVDASRYISHLVVSTEYVGPAVFVPSSPLEDARRELRTILRGEIGIDFSNPVFVLDEDAFTSDSWLAYAEAVAAAIVVYNTSDDVLAIRAAGQLVLSTKAALVAMDVILVELTPTPDWLFWQDFDGNTGGLGSLQVQALGSVVGGVGIGGSHALQSTMAPGDTARLSFPAQDVVYIRFYTRSNVTGVGGFWARAYHNANWGANMIRLNAHGNGSISPQVGGSEGQMLQGTTGVLSSAEWVGLEMRFDMNEGNITTWVDGRLQGTVSLPAGLLATQIANFQFHKFTGYGNGTRYYDNFVVSTSYIGPMHRQFVEPGAPDKAALSAAITAQIGADRDNWVFVLNEADYTADSWAAYVAAIEAAIVVEADTNATQSQINAAADGIAAARNALVPLQVDPRANWLFWDNFDGDTGGAGTLTTGNGGEIGAFGATGQGFRNTLADGTTPLTIQFPVNPIVYISFDVRSNVAGAGYAFWARVHNGQDWGVNSFRLNAAANGSITSQGAGAVAGTAGALSTDDWQNIEIRFDIPARAKTIWIDGEFAGTGPMQHETIITQISRFQLHSFNSQGTGTRDYDNFVVSTSRIGEVEWEVIFDCDLCEDEGCEVCDPSEPRANWLYWNNFEGDTGSVTGASFTANAVQGGTIGAFGINGTQGFRDSLNGGSATPLVIRFPANEIVYIRFDVRSDITGPIGGWLGRIYLGQSWGTSSFRLNISPYGSIASAGAGHNTAAAGALSTNTWQSVEIRFNIPAAQKTIWINGVLAGSGPVPMEAGRTVTQVDGFEFHHYSGMGVGYRYFDNFVVSTSRIGAVTWN